MKLSKTMRIATVGLLTLGLVVFAGCAVKGGTNDQTLDRGNDAQASDGTVSTAMVAYANGDEILFVDQDTQTPYLPTNINDATIIFNGETIEADGLEPGNIVKVTGNGIMLESYPGQYPGITAVEVTEVGSPADAEQYAAIVDTVFAAPDYAEVPTGNLDYKTTDAQVSTMLTAYEYEWAYKAEDGTTTSTEADGAAFATDGAISKDVADARIAGATDAFAAFSVTPTSVEIDRQPLVKGDATVDPNSPDEDVSCTIGEDGTVAFIIEPNFLYELKATFPQGEAEYAFYTVS